MDLLLTDNIENCQHFSCSLFDSDLGNSYEPVEYMKFELHCHALN
jgi:hypothetical protein